MIPYAIIFALAIMGVNETVYLIRKRLAFSAPVCIIGDDCEKVLTSKHKNIFVIPLDVWGLLFYLSIALSCAIAVIGIGESTFWSSFLSSVIALGGVLSLFFTYLQWRVIKAWCFWCLTSAFTVWTMGIIILISRVL